MNKLGVILKANLGIDVSAIAADSGVDVLIWDLCKRSEEELKEMMKACLMERGTAKSTDKFLEKVTVSKDMDILEHSDIVIEFLPDKIMDKVDVLKKISNILKSEMIVCTSTSSLSITELASSVKYPESFIGLHFVKMPYRFGFVEIIRGELTTDNAISSSQDFCEKIGMESVVVEDCPGGIINSLLLPYINQALEGYDRGLASRDDLDLAVRMGLGYPMGPLEFVDHFGIDNLYVITSNLHARNGDSRFFPPDLMRRMVFSGKVGKKAGKGFYDWGEVA